MTCVLLTYCACTLCVPADEGQHVQHVREALRRRHEVISGDKKTTSKILKNKLTGSPTELSYTLLSKEGNLSPIREVAYTHPLNHCSTICFLTLFCKPPFPHSTE